MRYQFLLVPAAAVATMASPAAAMDIQSLAQVQAALFPNATFTPADITLTPQQIDKIQTEVGTAPLNPVIKGWKASTGGWLYVDQCIGLLDVITYAVAVDKTGAVTGVEIMVCAEGFCETSTPQWRNQFKGKKFVSGQDLSKSITLISGQTLSTSHTAWAIERVLTAHALYAAK